MAILLVRPLPLSPDRWEAPAGGNHSGFNSPLSLRLSLSSTEIFFESLRGFDPTLIGVVIGKGGGIIKALREDTQAKITVADSAPGSDERVIIIFSPSTKNPRKHYSDEDLTTEKEDDLLEPHCAAQDALLKVHDRIIEEDLFGGVEGEVDNENMVTARLLVPNNMVGCLLGKKGDVIQRLRSETGASIRVLPPEHLPACAMSTDELVAVFTIRTSRMTDAQLISGKPVVAKRALYEVSTLLHQNPRKDQTPLSLPLPYGGQGFHPPGPPMPNMLPPGNTMWSQRKSNSHGMPPMPWMEEFGNQSSGFGSGGFNGGPAGHGREAPSDFSMKILCSAGNIGMVIGKGGCNVKQLQQETGASIHVEDTSPESEERVIRVSSFEALWNPRSQTIDAILQLQNKTSEFSEKGFMTTRLLVPSSKVGCILGQGGHVINEMRRRTRADIRVYSKKDKPKYAAEDEELVQISGNLSVARDALAEIASRLRARCLQGANAGLEPPSVGPVHGFGATGNLPGGGPHPPGSIGAGSSIGYELSKIGETRLKLQDFQSGGSECTVEIRGRSEHLNTAQSVLKAFIASGQNTNPPQGSYQNINNPQNAYPNINTPQTPYQNISAQQAPYQNVNVQQAPYQNQNVNVQQAAYQNVNVQQAPYQNFSALGSYQY
ncbi:hypothetical protein F0562_005276 [Nyssa sinensis]|uniref:K Homology domain-containing protein n=1 Tax=Nyssa sinensis TaxID=561372 RepID=A0A5J5AM38_9ASTE|nr:hypothetical protein F0562_005276 [Nyssa sinensis]